VLRRPWSEPLYRGGNIVTRPTGSWKSDVIAQLVSVPAKYRGHPSEHISTGGH